MVWYAHEPATCQKAAENIYQQQKLDKWLEKIVCLRKFEVSVERFSVNDDIENFAEMAYTVCHAPLPITSSIWYCNNYESYLSAIRLLFHNFGSKICRQKE